MSVNTKYKDSVFTKLFNDEDRLRELYAALEGIEYDPTIPIIINTLEDILYNGPGKAPEKWELRLSDAFMGLEAGEKISLDLTVRVYDINYGQNTELLQRSENLFGYVQFVAKVRENQASMPLEQAVSEAVRYCIRNRILARFLEEHGGEVVNMAFGEWDWDEAKEAWQEEAREEGIEKGMEKNQEQVLELIDQGYTLEQLKARLTENLQKRG